MDLSIEPLTPDLWPAFDDLFDTTGAVGRCWCMYWRIGSSYRDRPPEENRAALLDIVAEGPPPGLLAMVDGRAVGWCQMTARDQLPAMDRGRTLARVDDVPVWAISCFSIRRGWRKKGVASALAAAAAEFARDHGAEAIEAYPLDAGQTPSSSFTGYQSMFEALGFEEIERRSPARPIMRLSLG